MSEENEQKVPSHVVTPRPSVPIVPVVPRAAASFTAPTFAQFPSVSVPSSSPANSVSSFSMVSAATSPVNAASDSNSIAIAALQHQMAEISPVIDRMSQLLITMEARESKYEREHTDKNVNPRRGSDGDRRSSMRHLVPNTPFQNTVIFEDQNELSEEDNNTSNNSSSQPITPSNNQAGSFVPLKHVKFDAPEKYTGNQHTNAISLLVWCSQMEIYLTAIGVPLDSKQSLDVASTRLSEMAFIWFISIRNREEKEIASMSNTRQNYSINCWNDLKKAMNARYVPQQQQQISMNRLLGIRFTGSVDNYNQRFCNELMLLPELAEPNMEPFVMSIYARGMVGPGADYFSHIIQQALSKDEVKTIHSLMDMVRLAEQAQKMARDTSNSRDSSRNPILANRFTSGNRSNRFSKTFNSSSKTYPNRSFDSNPNWRSNQTPIKALNFSTPAKLNHMNMLDEYGIDPDENDFREADDVLDQDANADNIDYYDEDNSQNNNHGPDGNQTATNGSDEENSFLNAIRMYEQVKQEVPGITPDEIDRRRRNGTCFRCNKEGHFADKCPLRINKQNFDKKKNF